jgi:hypothetical protein
MSKAQPGSGYGFTSSGYGFTLNTEQPFAAYVSTSTPPHPFKLINVGLRASGESTTVTYQVKSGTINNIVPKIDDYITSTEVKLDRVTSGVADPPTAELTSSNYESGTKTCYITLRTGAKTASPYNYPDSDVNSNQYPVIIGANQITPESDTWGYLLIGTITVDNITTPTSFTVSQNITGSLWGDRIKVNGRTASYYYARI